MTSTEGSARSRVALLDVNVLIALHDADHIHHQAARDWMVHHAAGGWATCPLTQNGCLRILCQPGYSHPVSATLALETLSRSCSQPHHRFWPDDISLLDAARLHHAHIHGHGQLTGLYLLALAVKHGGCLVTFDARIPLSAVHGARAEHLVSL